MYLEKPDEVTAQALKRLAQNSEFRLVAAWLENSMCSIDARNRSMLDATLLRMQQGASGVLQEFLDVVAGKHAARPVGEAVTRNTG